MVYNQIKRVGAAMDNPHKGHRKRLREQFLKNGLESMQPHQVLELLLFFSIPQADTNVYAHNLLDRFGSIAGVFNAGFDELQTVNGIGENSATLIKLIPQLYARYATSAFEGIKLKSSQDMCRFFIAQFYGVTIEETRLVCLDDMMNIVLNSKLSSGDPGSVACSPRKIVETVIKSGCNQCILSHNHPKSSCEPSKEDYSVTMNLQRLLREIGITLIDHVVVGRDGARTILNGEVNILPKREQQI